MTKKTKAYEVYCYGANKKLEKNVTVEATGNVDAKRKAMAFSVVAGLRFSHVQEAQPPKKI